MHEDSWAPSERLNPVNMQAPPRFDADAGRERDSKEIKGMRMRMLTSLTLPNGLRLSCVPQADRAAEPPGFAAKG
jgi:hypothetical protein